MLAHIASYVANRYRIQNCVTCPPTPGGNTDIYGFTLKQINVGGKSLTRMCEEMFRCHLVRIAGVVFQACSFNHSDISPFRISHLRAVWNSVAQNLPSNLSDLPFHLYSAGCRIASALKLCKTSQCRSITYGDLVGLGQMVRRPAVRECGSRWEPFSGRSRPLVRKMILPRLWDRPASISCATRASRSATRRMHGSDRAVLW